MNKDERLGLLVIIVTCVPFWAGVIHLIMG